MSKDKCSKEGQVSSVKKLRELIKRNKTAVGVVFALAFVLILTPTDCIIKYEIMNAGGNTASRLQLTLDGYPLFPDFALAKDHVKKIVFVLPLREGEKQSRYVLKFKYGDIVSPTTYLQIETLNIVQDEYGVTFSQSMDDLLTAPKKENKSRQDEI